jgi:predicted transposase
MHTVLTAKLKLHTTPDQFRALRQMQLAYRNALNYVSRYAFAHGQMSDTVGLQEGTYQDISSRFGLPAQMACSVSREVAATYKALWTKVKANAAARAAGRTKKRYQGLDQPPRYVSPTLMYQLGHDYGFKSGQQVSILTLEGRVIVPHTGYARHVALIQQGAHIVAANLWYDQPRKQFYLLIRLELEVADPTPASHQRLVGVDVGQRYLAVASDTRNRTMFYASPQVRATADHYARLRKRLQHKGARSATRRLVVIATRERRVKQDRNHLISRRLVDAYPHALIGLEDLTPIRERTHRARRHGKRASQKQRRASRHESQWSFAELQAYLPSQKAPPFRAGDEWPLAVSTAECYAACELLLSPWDIMAWSATPRSPGLSRGEMSRCLQSRAGGQYGREGG